MYDFVPVCQTDSGLCLKSNVKLCDLKPPQFPAWFNAEKKSMLMKTCPSWKAYQENCKTGFDTPPWWLALLVLTFLLLMGLVILILYKKKRLKWASRVSDVSLQAKQMCCKQTVQPSEGSQKEGCHSYPRAGIADKTPEGKDGVTGRPVDKSAKPGEPTEPYYYVLEDPGSVVLTKTSPTLGTFGQRVISPGPPPPYSPRLPPLGTVNNNGVTLGKPAVLFYTHGEVLVCEQGQDGRTEKRKKQGKCKKRKPHSSVSQQPSTPNIDDKYMYVD